MRTALMFVTSIVLAASASVVNAQDVNVKIAKVPECLPESTRVELLNERSRLVDQFKEYNNKVEEFRGKCSLVEKDTALYRDCLRDQNYLGKRLNELSEVSNAFKSKVDSATEAASSGANFANAADLVASMNAASSELQQLNRQPKGPVREREVISRNCQDFFRMVLRGLGQRRQKNGREWNDPFPRMNADQIARTITNDRTGSWQELHSYSEIQSRANRGGLIVGVTPADLIKERELGHLAVVFPAPPCFDAAAFDKDGSGPFVRDGNEHDLRNKGLGIAMSGWGAVKASRATPLGDTRWFLFVPSTT